ncbi:MAG TPA: GTP-binding protein [Burkholderiales bacterium]|nr:GTP-binding protein [Burkholderiales bacterium]
MQPRTPVSIITGFLGSGKTTLLNRVLQDPAMAGAAVIINEFGEIGLDHLLIATPNENTVLLASGCICCTVRGDLVDTLRNLDRQRQKGQLPPFDRVLIETTGLADPVPIIQTVVTDEQLAPRFELDGVLTLVDAVNGMQQLDAQPEAVKQAAVADRLVLTKMDIAPVSDELLSRLTRLNPGARRLTASHGDIGAHQLFGVNLGAQAGADELSRWLPEVAVAQVEAQYTRVQAHDDHIRAYSVYLDEPVSATGVTAWLTALASLRGANLLRVKGLLNVDGEPVVVHAVQTLIHEPVTLARWPDADRRSRLVFITRELSREQIESTLDLLRLRATYTAAQPQPLDPQAYAKFVAAMKKIH